MTAAPRPVPIAGTAPAAPESEAEELARLRRENAALKGQLLALASSALAVPAREKRAPRRRLVGIMAQLFLLATGVALGVAWTKGSSHDVARGFRDGAGIGRTAVPMTDTDALTRRVVENAEELQAIQRELEPGR